MSDQLDREGNTRDDIRRVKEAWVDGYIEAGGSRTDALEAWFKKNDPAKFVLAKRSRRSS